MGLKRRGREASEMEREVSRREKPQGDPLWAGAFEAAMKWEGGGGGGGGGGAGGEGRGRPEVKEAAS